MKKSVAITAVLALHLAVATMFLVHAGCTSNQDSPEVGTAKTSVDNEPENTLNKDDNPDEMQEAEVELITDSAQTPSEGSLMLRSDPSRPDYKLGNSKEVLVSETTIEENNTPSDDKELKPIAPKASSQTYTVKKGDTITNIARKHKLYIDELMAANSLNKNSILKIGQVLTIPAPEGEVKMPEASTMNEMNEAPSDMSVDSVQYTVVKGDSLSRIGQKFHMSIKELMQMNNLKNHNIRIGQKLLVSKNAKAKKETKQEEVFVAENEVSYRVMSGDTLGAIANKYKSSVASILKRNNITDARKLKAGQTIIIPTKAPVAKKVEVKETPAPVVVEKAEPTIQVQQDTTTIEPISPATTPEVKALPEDLNKIQYDKVEIESL